MLFVVVDEPVTESTTRPATGLDESCTFGADPDVDVGRNLFIDRDNRVRAFDHEGRVALVQLDRVTGPHEQVIELVKLLIARSIHIGDPGGFSDLQLKQGNDGAFHHLGLLSAALAFGDGHSVWAFPRMAEKCADAVHQVRI